MHILIALGKRKFKAKYFIKKEFVILLLLYLLFAVFQNVQNLLVNAAEAAVCKFNLLFENFFW
jgi:hypothetical protein